MSKTIADVNKERKEINKTTNNTYGDFKKGDEVEIICVCQDNQFFPDGLTGKVIENRCKYLGIMVECNGKREGENSKLVWGFNPDDLKLINRTRENNNIDIACDECGTNNNINFKCKECGCYYCDSCADIFEMMCACIPPTIERIKK